MAFLFTRLLGFGDGEVSPAFVGFLGKMIASTPIEVVSLSRISPTMMMSGSARKNARMAVAKFRPAFGFICT